MIQQAWLYFYRRYETGLLLNGAVQIMYEGIKHRVSLTFRIHVYSSEWILRDPCRHLIIIALDYETSR